MRSIYLDYNATTPIAPEVADAMEPCLRERFGNPSSNHPYGIEARKAVAEARDHVAALLECSPPEIVFTSGGTESNNHAIIGAALARREKGNHIITSAIEHPAVTEVCRHLAGEGFRITTLPVDGEGLVNPADLKNALSRETILVTIMLANNEVGTILPIRELAEIARTHGAIFHTDAAQAVGKIPVSVRELGVDLLSIAGHKLYAPKGVGALYIAGDVNIVKILHGADHENNRRPGTESVLQVVGLGRACELARDGMQTNITHLRMTRDALYDAIAQRTGSEGIRLNGPLEPRLPNTLSLAFHGIEGDRLLAAIGDRVAASAGAACHTGEVRISHVLSAMGIPADWAAGTIRLSTGRETSMDDVAAAAEAIAENVIRLRR